MSSLRACSVVLVAMAGAAACTEPEAALELGETEQLSSLEQGNFHQGNFHQGNFHQGNFHQGATYNGNFHQGSTQGGIPLTNGSVQGTALVVWKLVTSNGVQRYEQRFPNRICTWDITKTIFYGCTYNRGGGASPLYGATFPVQFALDGQTVNATVQIATTTTSTTTAGVIADSSSAMHPLTGASTCPLVYPSSSNTCDNPAGCRVNCDIWLYDLKLTKSDGVFDFCPNGDKAIALAGLYDATGARSGSATKFTFACLGGTIAKCTRVGYRSFGSATKSDGSVASMLDYHQACVRAAMADYCSEGNSFTLQGTLVDIFDYDNGATNLVPHAGFIPSTITNTPGATAFGVPESMFDRVGAAGVDYHRYAELEAQLGGINDAERGCPERFSHNPNDDVGMEWDRQGGYLTPNIVMASSTACQHAESNQGKWLHVDCSGCTNKVHNSVGPTGLKDRTFCTDPSDARGWNGACVARAQSVCTASGWGTPMTAHSECTSGTKLAKYGTGCTARVCSTKTPSKDYSTCCSGTWDASCVSAANTYCPAFNQNGVTYSFCGYAIANPPPNTL